MHTDAVLLGAWKETANQFFLCVIKVKWKNNFHLYIIKMCNIGTIITNCLHNIYCTQRAFSFRSELEQKHRAACRNLVPNETCIWQAWHMWTWSLAALPSKLAGRMRHTLTLDDVAWDPTMVVGRWRWWTTPPLTLRLLILFSLICQHRQSLQVHLIVKVTKFAARTQFPHTSQ